MGAGRRRGVGLIVIVVILLLLIVGGGAIFILSSALQPAPGGGQGAEVTPTAVSTTKLIVAARDIRRGTRLAADDVTTIEWPINVPLPPDALTAGQTNDQPGLEQVADRVARVDILSGQPVLSHMVTSGPAQLQTTGSDAALLIPSGQVAVAFPFSRLSGVAYAIRTGDHVDILMSFRFVDVDEDFQTILPNFVGATGPTSSSSSSTGESTTSQVVGRVESGPFGTQIVVIPSEPLQRPRQVTQVVIKNAVVLRVGDFPLTDINEVLVVTSAPQPEATATPGGSSPEQGPTAAPLPVPDIITLVMSRQDALVLKYSLETGADIDFALRSALDNDITDVTTDSVTLQYLMDIYGIDEPPKLPLAQEPRISESGLTGDFPLGSGAAAATPPPE